MCSKLSPIIPSSTSFKIYQLFLYYSCYVYFIFQVHTEEIDIQRTLYTIIILTIILLAIALICTQTKV